jgi:hypothetical protein
LAVESLAAGGDDTTAVLVDFVDRVADEAPPSPTSAAAVANDPELELLLLTLDEFPTGWSIAPPGLFDDDDGEDSCSDIVGAELHGVAGLPRASVSFLSDSLVDVVGEMILQADSSEAARAIVDEIAAAFEACPVAVDDDGLSVSYAEMSFPELGDVTVVYRAIPHSSSPPLSLALVAVAVDDRVALLVGGGTGGDFALFEQLAVTAVEKAGCATLEPRQRRRAPPCRSVRVRSARTAAFGAVVLGSPIPALQGREGGGSGFLASAFSDSSRLR